MGARRLTAKGKRTGWVHIRTHTHVSPQIAFSLCSWHKIKAEDLHLRHSKNLKRYKAIEQKRKKGGNRCKDRAGTQCPKTKITLCFVIGKKKKKTLSNLKEHWSLRKALQTFVEENDSRFVKASHGIIHLNNQFHFSCFWPSLALSFTLFLWAHWGVTHP